MSSRVWRNSVPGPMSTGTARPWTVTESSSPGRCVALTWGRALMWRKRTESGGEPKGNERGRRLRADLDRAAREDPAHRADARAPVGGAGGERQKAHPGDPLGHLLGGEAPL